MFRKVGHIILSVFLLITTTGVSFSMHFCGGELVSASFNSELDQNCCGDSCGCCDDKIIQFEITDDYDSFVELIVNSVQELDLLLSSITIHLLTLYTDLHSNTEWGYKDKSPPDDNKLRLALLQTYRN